jgi:hypothetical protein
LETQIGKSNNKFYYQNEHEKCKAYQSKESYHREKESKELKEPNFEEVRARI